MIEYYATLKNGKTVYIDNETCKLYLFTQEEINEAENFCSYNPIEYLKFDDEHFYKYDYEFRNY